MVLKAAYVTLCSTEPSPAGRASSPHRLGQAQPKVTSWFSNSSSFFPSNWARYWPGWQSWGTFFFFFLRVYFPWGMCKKLEIFYCNIEYIIHIIRCDAPLAGFLHPLGFFQRREDFCWVSNTCTAYISFFISVL